MGDSFVFYADWWDHLQLLDESEQLLVIRAIFCFERGEEVPALSSAAAVAFSFIKAQLYRDRQKWAEIREKRAEAGRKGGLATQSKQTKANQANVDFAKASISEQEQVKANQAVTVPVPATVPVPEESKADKRPRVPRFSPPTVEEVRTYCQERHNGIDAEQFVDFYTSKGWMIGNGKMKDWRAAIRTWERRDNSTQADGGENFGTKL